MEAVAWAAGQPHSDHPPCVCESFWVMGRSYNDFMTDEERQPLKKYIYRVLGTAGDGLTEQRTWMVVDWSLREVTAQIWDVLKMPEQAAELRALAEINNVEPLKAAFLVLESGTDPSPATSPANRGRRLLLRAMGCLIACAPLSVAAKP